MNSLQDFHFTFKDKNLQEKYQTLITVPFLCEETRSAHTVCVHFTYLQKREFWQKPDYSKLHKLVCSCCEHSSSAAWCCCLLFAWLILNQCHLTRHGKYWSSFFPMPKQPLTFFPQTNSSPRSAKQPSNMNACWAPTQGSCLKRVRAFKRMISETWRIY